MARPAAQYSGHIAWFPGAGLPEGARVRCSGRTQCILRRPRSCNGDGFGTTDSCGKSPPPITWPEQLNVKSPPIFPRKGGHSQPEISPRIFPTLYSLDPRDQGFENFKTDFRLLEKNIIFLALLIEISHS